MSPPATPCIRLPLENTHDCVSLFLYLGIVVVPGMILLIAWVLVPWVHSRLVHLLPCIFSRRLRPLDRRLWYLGHRLHALSRHGRTLPRPRDYLRVPFLGSHHSPHRIALREHSLL